MKKLYLLSTILLIAFVLIYSCSAEEEDTSPPPALVQPQEPEPDPTQYTLTVSAGDGGTVSTEGGTYDEGTSLSISAIPEAGYEFVGWEGSDSNLADLSITLNSNTTLEANFQRLSFVSRSERYSSINETTGYYKKTKYFDNYLLPQELDAFAIRNSLTSIDAYWNYRIFDQDKIIGDFDKNGYNDFFLEVLHLRYTKTIGLL